MQSSLLLYTARPIKSWDYWKSVRTQFGFKWLPRIDRDYSLISYCDQMARGEVDSYFLFGQNPAAGASNGRLVRHGLRSLKWLVCLDWFETESAVFWKNDPTGPPSTEIGTEVFFIPAAPAPCKEGTLTNTERLIQWHDKALDPDGDCRSDAWFVYNLGRKLKELYGTSIDPRDSPLLNLTWDYDFDEPPRLPDGALSRIETEPDVAKVLKEINGYHLDRTDPKTGKLKLLSGFSDCKDDGTTSCGCWIYSGIFPQHDRNRARDRVRTATPVQSEWAYAWPHNRRIMYNRASAKPDGTPWSERKKYLWWDEQTQKWTGHDEPITAGKYANWHRYGAIGLGLVVSTACALAPIKNPKTRRALRIGGPIAGLAGGFALRWALIHGGRLSPSSELSNPSNKDKTDSK